MLGGGGEKKAAIRTLVVFQSDSTRQNICVGKMKTRPIERLPRCAGKPANAEEKGGNNEDQRTKCASSSKWLKGFQISAGKSKQLTRRSISARAGMRREGTVARWFHVVRFDA
jgi:hypothetical protein